MNGKLVAGFIVIVGAVAGVAMYYLQEYAYYTKAVFKPGAEIALTLISSGQPEAILAEGVEGIDADSSPLRFRACFHTPLTQAMLSETYQAYQGAVPLIAPSWFDCFDAAKIGAALENGEALAFLSQSNIAPSVDRVVAVFPDGRAYAWHQIHPGAEVQ
ncbi:DUF6446 family protein [Cypionkella sp.]|uniref:DUF6446 family protein n=1 Tax=Cypionkella sp. TaxID=2811411 RepID=UPI002773E052|nr:DUF6446 family protein [Cypionkella sp.]